MKNGGNDKIHLTFYKNLIFSLYENYSIAKINYGIDTVALNIPKEDLTEGDK